jgi:hypothetical protein
LVSPRTSGTFCPATNRAEAALAAAHSIWMKSQQRIALNFK